MAEEARRPRPDTDYLKHAEAMHNTLITIVRDNGDTCLIATLVALASFKISAKPEHNSKEGWLDHMGKMWDMAPMFEVSEEKLQ